MGSDGLAAGVGGLFTETTSDDTIYVTANNATLYRIDPITLALAGTATVGTYPIGIAVSRDDTVYVVNANSNDMTVVAGATMTVNSTVAVPTQPQAVALSRRAVDDTVFISSSSFFNAAERKITTLNARTLGDRVETLMPSSAPASPWGLAVANDDSAYIASYSANTIFRFNSATAAVSSVVTGAEGPIGVAVSSDDTVYFTREAGDKLSRFPTTDGLNLASLSVGRPQGVAVGPQGKVYVAGSQGGQGIITVVNPGTFTVDDTVAVGNAWSSIAVTRSGLAVAVDRNYHQYAVVIAEVTPTIRFTAGVAGETGSLDIGDLPEGVTVDDTTVSAISFGSAPATGWTRDAGTNIFSGPIPAGTGTVNVSVTLNGGNVVSAGAFTYITTPGAPTITGVTTKQTTASVSFSADDTGGSALTRVEFALDDTVTVDDSTTNTSSPYVLSGLSASTTYVAYMRVVNAAGTGPWSLVSSPFSTLAPPPPIPASAPGNVVATAGDQRASVSWSPPSSQGPTRSAPTRPQRHPVGRRASRARRRARSPA